MSMFRKSVAIVAALMLTASLAACSPGANPGGTAESSTPNTSEGASSLSGTLNVFAAASLKSTFTELAKEFQAANPQAKISLNFDGSSTLVTQITQGAPADVFASADEANMNKLTTANMAQGTPEIFATNILTVVVPPNNPANITSFADLAKPGVKVVVCAAQVPCGAAAKTDEATAGLSIKAVSEELNVTSVLGKVTSGEADAGLVYVTDATGAGAKVKAIPLGLDKPTVNKYPIVAVSSSKKQELAKAFIALVTAAQGQKILQEAGFGTP
ncbi:molybdate ABC transporter substrate-binding protein [Arthrobacter cryoconiti]|nr:molybdate ABC transporter substrate-binding protein [Arthrobacter cryoconiti]MCC9068401.1 molybdate ABC transporter substrate-binding protein [Arthrobacter cryoconiti]